MSWGIYPPRCCPYCHQGQTSQILSGRPFLTGPLSHSRVRWPLYPLLLQNKDDGRASIPIPMTSLHPPYTSIAGLLVNSPPVVHLECVVWSFPAEALTGGGPGTGMMGGAQRGRISRPCLWWTWLAKEMPLCSPVDLDFSVVFGPSSTACSAHLNRRQHGAVEGAGEFEWWWSTESSVFHLCGVTVGRALDLSDPFISRL